MRKSNRRVQMMGNRETTHVVTFSVERGVYPYIKFVGGDDEQEALVEFWRLTGEERQFALWRIRVIQCRPHRQIEGWDYIPY